VGTIQFPDHFCLVARGQPGLQRRAGWLGLPRLGAGYSRCSRRHPGGGPRAARANAHGAAQQRRRHAGHPAFRASPGSRDPAPRRGTPVRRLSVVLQCDSSVRQRDGRPGVLPQRPCLRRSGEATIFGHLRRARSSTWSTVAGLPCGPLRTGTTATPGVPWRGACSWHSRCDWA
jgi:hypothetical protein